MADFVAAEMRAIGLGDVAVEPVPVDGWRFEDARVSVVGGAEYVCASMGGAPPTATGGVLAPLIHVGTGTRRTLDRLDVRGCIALLDWSSISVPVSEIGLELGLRGVLGVILNCPDGGPFYQSERALGSFASHWFSGAPPLVTMCKEDAAELRDGLRAGPLSVRLTLRAELTPGSPGCNVSAISPVPSAAPRSWSAPTTTAGSGPRSTMPPVWRPCSRSRGRWPRRGGAAAHGLLHLAHGRGIWPDRHCLQLVHRRLGAGARHASGLGGGLAVPPLPGGQRPPRAAPTPRSTEGTRELGAPARPRRRGRGLADQWLARRRAAGHGHRAVAVPRLRRAGCLGLHLGAVLRAHRLPHPVRHGGHRRLRAPRAPLPFLPVPAAERGRGSRRHSRSPRPGARARQAGELTR